MRHPVLVFAACAAIAGARLAAPTPVHAQHANPGEFVQAVVKLNAAQLAFARRLASDAAYAQEFYTAIGQGNTDGAAGLVSQASGVARSAIEVATGRGDLDVEAAGRTEMRSTVRLASFTPAVRSPARAALQYNICFNFGFVKGCIAG